MVCSSIRWSIVALGFGLLAGGCMHGQDRADSVSPGVEAPAAALRRENAALKRRVQMLEDRMLRVERVTLDDRDAEPLAEAPRPRQTQPPLPAYEVEPETAAAGPMEAPGDGAGHTLGALQPAEFQDERLWADPSGLAETGEPTSPPSPAGAGGSYRLVGNELVQMTEPGAPKRADKPLRGKKGRSIKAEYDAALALLRRGAHDEATAAFSDFIAAHPRSDLADNAMYWKGEAAYDQAHYADALASFTAVVERYAGGNKASDALLKIGLCYAKLGDAANARDVLYRLIEAYPGATASDVARVKLAELSS